MRDHDSVNVTSSSSNLDLVDGTVVVVGVAVLFEALSAREHVHALRGRATEELVVGLRCAWDISAAKLSDGQ